MWCVEVATAFGGLNSPISHHTIAVTPQPLHHSRYTTAGTLHPLHHTTPLEASTVQYSTVYVHALDTAQAVAKLETTGSSLRTMTVTSPLPLLARTKSATAWGRPEQGQGQEDVQSDGMDRKMSPERWQDKERGVAQE